MTVDAAFLAWLRATTERAWAGREPPTFTELERGRVARTDWQRDTGWTGGLSAAEIDALEVRQGCGFPPDYRAFLGALHATNRPRVGSTWEEGGRMEPRESPGFYDWRKSEEIQAALDWVAVGLVLDVEDNTWWPAASGARPASAEERTAIVRAAVAAAPRLAPLFGNRYLVLEPCASGNPVLSIYGTDVIVYGGDLRDYLLAELGDFIEDEPPPPAEPASRRAPTGLWAELCEAGGDAAS